MKNNILCIFTILTCLLGCDKYDDSEVKSDIKDLKSRVEALEQQCKNMNANLTYLQAIVEAIQKQDGIVSVDDLPGGQGYSVKFVSGKVIFLYNGKNGEDGVTPMISVKRIRTVNIIGPLTVNGCLLTVRKCALTVMTVLTARRVLRLNLR